MKEVVYLDVFTKENQEKLASLIKADKEMSSILMDETSGCAFRTSLLEEEKTDEVYDKIMSFIRRNGMIREVTVDIMCEQELNLYHYDWGQDKTIR